MLLKIGAFATNVVMKAYGVPLPSNITFLDDIKDAVEIDVLKTNINDLIGHFNRLANDADSGFESGDADALAQQYTTWEEKDKSSGLETCRVLRQLLKHNKTTRNWDNQDIIDISKLDRVVHGDSGACIWVGNDDKTLDLATNEGFEPPQLH